MFKKTAKLLLKIAISIVALYFILHKMDLHKAIEMISGTNPFYFVAMLVLYLAGQYLSSLKWGVISQQLGFDFKTSDYINYYFTGMFFNLFLPTSVGGDVVKGYYLCKQEIDNKKTKALLSVFWDRLTGAMTLVLLSFVGLMFKSSNFLPLYAKLLIAASFAGVLCFVFFVPFAQKINLKQSIKNLFDNLIQLNKSKGLWKQIIVYALLFHVILVLIHVILAKDLGITIPVSYFLFVYPITSISGFLPISLNGIGVREAVYVYLLSLAGVSSEQAFAFSILWFLIILISSLFSVIYYLKSKQSVQSVQELSLNEDVN